VSGCCCYSCTGSTGQGQEGDCCLASEPAIAVCVTQEAPGRGGGARGVAHASSAARLLPAATNRLACRVRSRGHGKAHRQRHRRPTCGAALSVGGQEYLALPLCSSFCECLSGCLSVCLCACLILCFWLSWLPSLALGSLHHQAGNPKVLSHRLVSFAPRFITDPLSAPAARPPLPGCRTPTASTTFTWRSSCGRCSALRGSQR
jgi:hypothetical protein